MQLIDIASSRRAFAVVTILGVVAALAVIQLRRDDAPAEADGARLPVDDAATQQVAAAAIPAPAVSASATEQTPAPTNHSGDAAVSMCARIFEDVAEFAKMERDAANPDRASAPGDEQVLAEWENLQRNLAGSRDPELFLTAFLLDDPEARVSDDPSVYTTLIELGSRAANSDLPLLAWHALRVCIELEENCPFSYLQQDLLEGERNNAEAWALVATLKYRQGDTAGALSAMQDAARTSTSTWHWTESVALIERSLAAQTAIPYPILAGTGFGVMGGALPPHQSSLVRMCREESVASRTWAQACLEFSTLRWEHNETTVARAIAYPMREAALTALGDPEGAARVAAEGVLFLAELSSPMAGLQQALLETDPERVQDYLDAVREFGETAGLRMFLRQQLPPLLERAGLLERDGARECTAQLFEPPAAVETGSAAIQNYPIEYYTIQVGDQLQVSVRGSARLSTSLRVGPDGAIRVPRVPAIAAAGKTTGQIERELAALLSGTSNPPPEAFVTLISSQSPEQLRVEFDNALREVAERGDELR